MQWDFLGFRVWGFGVLGLGFWVLGFGFRVLGLGFRAEEMLVGLRKPGLDPKP